MGYSRRSSGRNRFLSSVVTPDQDTFNGLFSLLPRFSAERHEDFLGFVQKFEQVTKAMRLTYTQMAAYLPICLENFASQEFDILPNHVQADYDQAIEQLTQRFMRMYSPNRNYLRHSPVKEKVEAEEAKRLKEEAEWSEEQEEAEWLEDEAEEEEAFKPNQVSIVSISSPPIQKSSNFELKENEFLQRSTSRLLRVQ